MGRKNQEIHQVKPAGITSKTNSILQRIENELIVNLDRIYFRKIIILSLFIIVVVLFYKLNFYIPQITGQTSLSDFDIYYRLTNDLKLGFNPYKVSYMQTLGPPLVFLYYFPFSFFSLVTARSLITIINLAAGVWVCIILTNKMTFYRNNKLITSLILILFYFSSFPVRFSIEMGQPNILIGLFLSILLTNNKYISAVIPLIISIKTNYLILLISFIKNRKILLIKCVYWIILITTISMLFISPNWYVYYIKHTLQHIVTTNNTSFNLDYYNQSIFSTIRRFGFINMVFPVSYFIITVCLIITFQSGNILLGIIYSLIFSPVSWQHYYASIFPVYILALSHSKFNKKSVCFILILMLMWWIEFPGLHNAKINIINEILASHYFLSAFLLSLYIIFNKISFDKTGSRTL
jgi:hypothetical protein